MQRCGRKLAAASYISRRSATLAHPGFAALRPPDLLLSTARLMCTRSAKASSQFLPAQLPGVASLHRRAFANEASEELAARQQSLKDFVGASSPQAQKNRGGGEQREGGLSNWFYLFPAFTFCLGTWQIFRWREKQEMKQHRAERLLQPTADLPAHLSEETLEDFEFRHVEVQGQFEPVREFIVRPRTREGQNGGLLITPFRRSDDGTLVLVNRGWIPVALMNDMSQRRAMLDRVAGETKLFGLVRPGERGGAFSPENKLTDEQWYWIEIDKMQQALGLAYTPPILDLLATSGTGVKDTYPVPQPIATKLKDNHLNYIVTWYSLTAALVATILLKGRGHVRR